MGKFSLFLAIGAFIVGSYYVLGVNGTVVDNQLQVSTHTYRTLAREVALTGFGIADKGLKEAVEDYGNPSRSFTDTYNGGTYTVTVTNPPLTGAGPVMSTIEVVGEVQGESYRIQATYEKKLGTGSGEGGGGLPKFMQYGIVAGSSINISNTTRIYLDGPSINANIHSNRDLQYEGSNVIPGFGTYSAHLGDPGSINRRLKKFQPPMDPEGIRPYDTQVDPQSYHRAPTVDIPSFNAGEYRSVSHERHENNLLLEHDIEGGTVGNPKIIYVRRDLIVKQKARITGHVVFAVEGNIIIDGSLDNVSGGSVSNIAFYTKGEFNVNNSSAVIQGQILANNVNLQGTLYGSIAARGHINFNSSPTVYYRQASSGLTQPFWPGEETVGEPVIVLADFREHNVLKP